MMPWAPMVWYFPDQLIGASLKPGDDGHGLLHQLVFPRSADRGLIEADGQPGCRSGQAANFPDQLIGASLKR